MKQRITIDDLNQLADKGKERLREWWQPSSGDKIYLNVELYRGGTEWKELFLGDFIWDESEKHPWAIIGIGDQYENDTPYQETALPLLSIGQMIEFLYDNTEYNGSSFYGDEGLKEQIEGVDFYIRWSSELCDVLWNECLKILNK